MGRGDFEGEKGRPIVKYRDTVPSSLKMAEPVEIPFGLWVRIDPCHHVLDGAHGKGQFWGKGSPIVKYRDFLP